MGFKESIWEKIVEEDRGLVLITGETNSGKSTTLVSLLQHILDTQHKKVMTVEDPIEYALRDAVGQAVQREVGVTTTSFYEAVKRFLRQNPDIIMVGETRDEETAKQAVRAAETGHLVFTTLHTNDASGSVGRTLDFLGNTEESRHRLSDCLKYVVSQKLIPREKRTGDRTLAVEIMVVNGAIRNNIRTGKSENMRNVIQSGRSEGMMTMEQHLVYLVTKGLDRDVAIQSANNRREMESLLRQR
ncbi:hypothetical protein A3K73_06020 [Candidatus Pacearchaeota archaeon RBG_13_36_9]|nr:MAG: hypothetical protein A3K73_06020 [Candidatus Pacearchaeota archaeon RBG_13_36_9]